METRNWAWLSFRLSEVGIFGACASCGLNMAGLVLALPGYDAAAAAVMGLTFAVSLADLAVCRFRLAHYFPAEVQRGVVVGVGSSAAAFVVLLVGALVASPTPAPAAATLPSPPAAGARP